jgi:hypothetical protein
MKNTVECSTPQNPFLSKYSLFKEPRTFAHFSQQVIVQQTDVSNELSALKQSFSETNQPFLKWLMYQFLVVFGGVYAFFASFDGMSAVLTTLFPFINIGLLVAIGLVAAFCGLGVFLARDKMAIAETLEITEEYQLDLINDYLFHLERYYESLYQESLKETSDLSILDNIQYLKILKEIFEDKSRLNQNIIRQPMSYVQTQLILGIGAILFFSDGFFIGQSLALLISSFFALNSAALVLSMGIVIGLMALSSYWFVERPYVEKYLYQDLFTDESKVQASIERIDNQLQHLEKLKIAKDGREESKGLKSP